MLWDDDNINVRPKRAVGRPLEELFLLPETEEDFVVRGKVMLEKYFVPGGPNTRTDFVFGPERVMSKTQFWSIIYIYYEHEKLINPNLQGFVSAIIRHFGPEVVCDRGSISRNVNMQKSFFVYNKAKCTDNHYEARRQQKYRSMYQYVIKRWNEVVVKQNDDS